MKKVVGIIQARMGSSRFHGKMAELLGEYPLIQWVLRRVKQSTLVNEFILATSVKKENDYLENEANALGIKVFRGDEDNVLSRFVRAAELTDADIVVRICADNPFISSLEIDRIINLYIEKNPDYAFNHIPKLGNQYIDGLGAEVLSGKLLKQVFLKATSKGHFEHVTSFIWENRSIYDIQTIMAPPELSYPHLSLDVDTKEDLIDLNDILIKSNQFNRRPEDVDVLRLINPVC